MNSALADAADFFVTSGIVPVDSPSYIERPADEQTFRALARGELCLILAPRQSGKSSLMVHTMARLRREADAAVAIVDLQSLGGEKDIDRWFHAVIDRLQDREELNLSTDARAWWRGHSDISPTARFITFLEEVVLKECTGRVAIFFDEIDTLLGVPFGDDVFTTIRELVNMASRRPDLRRLSFALVGVADPVKLVRDPRRTSINVGRVIALGDFDRDAMGSFQRVFGPESVALFERIYHWTTGQPFLVQTLAAAMHALPPAERTPERVDAEVKRRFLDRDVDKELHLVGIKNVVIADKEQVRPALRLYQRVLANSPVPENRDSAAQNRLRLAGLVDARDGRLVPRNELYRRVFTQRWVRLMIGVDRTRQLVSATAGVAFLLALLAVGIALRPRLFPGFVNETGPIVACTADASFALHLVAPGAERAMIAGHSVIVTPSGAVEYAFSGLKEGKNQFDLALAGGLPTHERHRPVTIYYFPRWLVREMPDARLREIGYVPQKSQGQWELIDLADGARAPFKDVRSPFTTAPTRTDFVDFDPTRARRDVKLVTTFAVSGQADGRLRLWRQDYDGLTSRAWIQFGGPVRAMALGSGFSLGLEQTIFVADSHGTVSAIDPEFSMPELVRDADRAPDRPAKNPGDAPRPDRLLQLAAAPIVRGSAQVTALAVIDYRLAVGDAGGVVRLFDLRHLTSDLDRTMEVTKTVEAVVEGRGAFVRDAVLPHATLARQLSIAENVPMTDLALSQDGSRLAAVDASGRLSLWAVASGERLAVWSLGDGVTARLAFFPGGHADELLVATDRGEVEAFRPDSSGPPRAIGRVKGRPLSAAFMANGAVAFVATDGGEPAAWAIGPAAALAPGDGFRELQVLSGHTGEVRALALLPGDRLVSSGDDDGTLRFWDLRSGALLGKIDAHAEGVEGIAASPKGTLVASAGMDHSVGIWDVATGRKTADLRAHSDRVFGVAFSPDGRRLASNGADGRLIVWDVASGALEREMKTGGQGSDAVAFSARGDELFAAVGNEVQAWAPAKGTRVATYAGHSGDVVGIALSADGREMLTGSFDNTAKVWDLTTGRNVATLDHPKDVWGVAYSPDDKRFATGGYDGEIRIYDRATLKVLRKFKVEESVQPVLFTHDGRGLITGSMDHSIRQWVVGNEPPSYLEAR